MPVHGGGQNTTRTIAEDAQDILAMIEGGPDSRGGTQVGILNVDTHANFPHHWPTICMALRTLVDDQVPADQVAACAGLTHP